MKRITHLIFPVVLAACIMGGCRRGSGDITTGPTTPMTSAPATEPVTVPTTAPATNATEPTVTMPTAGTDATAEASLPQNEPGDTGATGPMTRRG